VKTSCQAVIAPARSKLNRSSSHPLLITPILQTPPVLVFRCFSVKDIMTENMSLALTLGRGNSSHSGLIFSEARPANSAAGFSTDQWMIHLLPLGEGRDEGSYLRITNYSLQKSPHAL
jgi:hypothetical protein